MTVPLLGVPRWQIRILSNEPVKINYTEHVSEPTLRPVLNRARTLIGRTSYMVNGPNREVMWSIERWITNDRKWVTVMQGRSRLRANAKAV